MRSYLSFIIFFVFVSALPAQRLLYRSDSYSVFSDRIAQSGFTARAKSRTEITSDYKSSFRKKNSRNIVLKFSINSLDNERAPGQDHRITLSFGEKTDTAFFVFGKPDTAGSRSTSAPADPFLDQDKNLLLRLDMREVLNAFKVKGYFQTYDGARITSGDFKGVYVAGANEPLNWNFPALSQRPEMNLKDPDGDGIYEVMIHFQKEFSPEEKGSALKSWTLNKNISQFPQYESPDILIDALYNQALEEMLLNIREDGAFMAGSQWTGIWTRDISYSILLSLAAVNPDASKVSLMAKVKNGIIIQDTGTGGAWPVSSDRVTWALAAWEVYKVTGDKNWLKKSYEIIKKSAEADLHNVFDTATGLFRGESSFLDWREQTYPRWMDPKDIYESKNLGTNAVHYETYRILSQMAGLLGQQAEGKKYLAVAQNIKQAMDKYFWMEDKGYYGQYLYGRNYFSLSPKSEALGEALSVLFEGITPSERQKQIIESVPVTRFGIPCIYPEIQNIPPYHNNTVWPFVESFWAWASAKTGNAQSVLGAMASVYRPAALYLTNKENLVATTGDFMGTEVNSDRQLWSLAGNLALTYRVIYGMHFTPDSLIFSPFIPREYAGKRTLKNLKYRNAVLEVTIEGYGSKIKHFTLDDQVYSGAAVPSALKGRHKLVIAMNNEMPEEGKVNMKEVVFTPETPLLRYDGSSLSWDKVDGASEYLIYCNGGIAGRTEKTEFVITENTSYAEWQVKAIGTDGIGSFLSPSVVIFPKGQTLTFQAEDFSLKENLGTDNRQQKLNNYTGFSGSGYIVLDKKMNREVTFTVDVPQTGLYSIDFRYANGSGPNNTENKCAIRTLLTDGKPLGPVVMPQRGDDLWNDWGYSNSLKAELTRGRHILTLIFDDNDNNMNEEVNNALLDLMRVTLLK